MRLIQRIALGLAAALFGSAALAQPSSQHGQIRLRIDTSNAEATLALLDGVPTAAERARFTALSSTADLARRARNWQLNLTPADMANLVEQARNGGQDPLQYHNVFRDREQIGALIAKTASEQAALQAFLNQRLGRFIPAGRTIDIEAILLLGGNSGGFTFGDASRMYVGAHLYRGDFLGFRNMLLHEAFHNVQAAVRRPIDLDACLSPGERAAYRFLEHAFREGSAEFVADIWAYGEDSAYTAIQRGQMEVNRNDWRLRNIGRLLDFAVVNAANGNGAADPEVLTVVLTDWNWHNPVYYYGYQATKALIARHGQEKLAHYLREGPHLFFQDYLALPDAERPNPFTDAFREIVGRLAQKAPTCPAAAISRIG